MCSLSLFVVRCCLVSCVCSRCCLLLLLFVAVALFRRVSLFVVCCMLFKAVFWCSFVRVCRLFLCVGSCSFGCSLMSLLCFFVAVGCL